MSAPDTEGAAKAAELAIALYLVSGWLPWGTDWRCDSEPPCIPLCPRVQARDDIEAWVLCCGHVVSVETMMEWFSEGYVVEGPPSKRRSWRTVVAGPNIGRWLGGLWHAVIPNDDPGPL